MINHILSEHRNHYEEQYYRVYVSDLLRLILKQLGIGVEKRYAELIEPPRDEDNKSADEIALEVITKAGLKGH